MTTRPETPVEQQIRESDGLPNQRAALPPGTLPGPPPDPQGDENRTPPPIETSGAGPWERTLDRGHADVSPSGNREPAAPTLAKPTGEAMSSTTEKARDIFIVGLRNQHAIEKQAIELLERQVGRLENYPEMSARMRQHIAESEEQARRIEELLAAFGTSHSTLKDTVTSVMGNLAALGHTVAPDEVLKNTMANFAFEHYEIASYLSLLTLAEATGHDRAKLALTESLREEERMAQWIQDHIGPTTLRYVERSAAGQTAGV
ncbi:MAG TPA: ferritin-like domain-containing protein [Acetobacteraceae bacterium]|nr:ferritin-like domain-containing protein [Acetobacteraceae bacterium]